jgi:hypothetical protein
LKFKQLPAATHALPVCPVDNPRFSIVPLHVGAVNSLLHTGASLRLLQEKMMNESQPQPLLVSRKEAARIMSVSTDTIDSLLSQNRLERVDISERRIGITTRSLNKLVYGEVA